MDARLLKAAILISTFTSLGATYRTPNFVVNAPTAEAAEQVGKAAEHYRSELAVAWLGEELPQWYRPCPITVKVGQIGAGGATTFSFDQGEVFGWRMRVQGSMERILDSVIPHEVSHTIFACHFRRPLPRWADEGAATLIEHASEKKRQEMLLKQVWNTKRRIPLRKLLAIKEYPQDMRNVLTLYAEGYSLADFLVQAGGKSRYLRFIDDAHSHGWDQAIQLNYKVKTVEELEKRWSGWVIAGSPPLQLPKGQQLASSDNPAEKTDAVIRSQSPDEEANPREEANRPRRPRRGLDLTAPLPPTKRKRANNVAKATPQSAPSSRLTPAQLQAINDGWIPLPNKRSRQARPAPLSTRIPRTAANSTTESAQDPSPFGDMSKVGVRIP